MRRLVTQLQSPQLEQCSEITVNMLTLNLSGIQPTPRDEALVVIEEFNNMWRDLRAEHELDDEEAYFLCRETGWICVEESE